MKKIASFLHRLLSWPVRVLIKTNPIAINVSQEINVDIEKPIVYLIENHSFSDKVAMQQACEQLQLPLPQNDSLVPSVGSPSVMFLQNPDSFFSKASVKSETYSQFQTLINAHKNDKELDIQLIPVSLCWGRTPDSSPSTWVGLFADRASPNWLRKFMIVLLLGRDNFVSFSPALSLRFMTDKYNDDQKLVQKLVRVAGVHFFRRRQAMTGPNHIDKQQLVTALLATDSVKQALKNEQTTKSLSSEEAKQLAKSYIKEIAADYNDSLIRLSDRILKKVWNKIYNGIKVHHADGVRELANAGHEIIYVPCHRSHMDYVLLTYVIYHQGLVTPHIAAGINLNFWPVGGFFRRAGAFFLRRSFGGNKVYTAVFKEYLDHLFSQGVPVKFYPEGGRSRTGRLLPAKTGMLAMTVQSALRNKQRPISLIPVYIGYEHVMEVGSYLKELKGKSKKKESLWQTFAALKKLKNYGYGFLNFGQPISLTPYLNKYRNENDETSADKRPAWVNEAVSNLAIDVMQGINQAAALNNMTLCSVCILASKQKALPEGDLKHTINDYLRLFKSAPYSHLLTLPEDDADNILEKAIALKKFTISEDSFGRIIGFDEQTAIAHTYYRNNVIHLFALPALIAAAVIKSNGIEKSSLMKIIEQIYPLMKSELFIHFSLEEALRYADTLVTTMKEQGVLIQSGRKIKAPDDKQYLSLSLLNNLIQDTLQRYSIVLSILEKSGTIARGQLEKESVMVAERLSALHGIKAPEFYDKHVLKGFINALRTTHILNDTEQGLEHSGESHALHQTLISLTDADIAQSLLSIS